MRDGVDVGDVEVSVESEETAVRLREDCRNLTLRVNMDLTTQNFNLNDPVSVEMAIAWAERSVDYHLQAFAENVALQSLAPEIKQKFRAGIQAQVPDTHAWM